MVVVRFNSHLFCAAASPPTGTSVASSSPAYASRAHSQTTPGGQFNAESTGAFKSGYTSAVPQQDPAKASNFAAAPTGMPEFPAITPFLASKYGDAYKHATKDANGSVAGQEVLRMLASVPVNVSVKKGAWDLVAGTHPCHSWRLHAANASTMNVQTTRSCQKWSAGRPTLQQRLAFFP